MQVKGDDELRAAMAAISVKLGDLDAGPQAAADLIAAHARSHAPQRTGRLARSVVGRAAGGAASVGSPLDYGLPVEFGVPARGQRARPFLRRAVEASTPEILAAYVKEIQATIDKEV